MTKIQITITEQESQLLAQKATLLGYDVTKYVKFLISKEALATAHETPIFQMSDSGKKQYDQATLEHKVGKSLLLKDIDDLHDL